jgi:hypothetical protein
MGSSTFGPIDYNVFLWYIMSCTQSTAAFNSALQDDKAIVFCVALQWIVGASSRYTTYPETLRLV